MLLDENFGGREERDLMTIANDDHRGDQSDDGLAAADIALQQPIHRPLRFQIAGDFA